jgi:hypothetical protein
VPRRLEYSALVGCLTACLHSRELPCTATSAEWDPKPAHFAPLLDRRSVPINVNVAAAVSVSVNFNVNVVASRQQ